MLTSNIKFYNFRSKKKFIKILDIFKLLKENFNDDLLLSSLSARYKDAFKITDLTKYKKFNSYNLIGMGGSSLGAKAIYSFLKLKIKKKFSFFDNIKVLKYKKNKDKKLNIVISKSGNTLETIV